MAGPPLAMSLEKAANAARDIPNVHEASCAEFEDIFVSTRPQAETMRVMERSLIPDAPCRNCCCASLEGSLPEFGSGTAWSGFLFLFFAALGFPQEGF